MIIINIIIIIIISDPRDQFIRHPHWLPARGCLYYILINKSQSVRNEEDDDDEHLRVYCSADMGIKRWYQYYFPYPYILVIRTIMSGAMSVGGFINARYYWRGMRIVSARGRINTFIMPKYVALYHTTTTAAEAAAFPEYVRGVGG